MVVAAAFLAMLVVMLVVVAAAFLAMLMVVMLMVVAAAFLAMLVVMLVVVAAAFLAVLVVVMFMVMTAATAFLAMLVVVMLMVMAAAVAFLAMLVVVMVMLLLLGQLLQRRSKSIPAFHGRQQLLPVQFVPRGRHDGRSRVLFPQQRNTGIQLVLLHPAGAAQNNGTGVLHLVVEKLAEILHIHLGLGGVHHGGKAVQHHIRHLQILHRTDNVAQLSDAGRLDKDPVRVIGVHHLPQRLAEIPNQTAADAAAVHFGNVDPGLLQKAAVNADLTKLIFNEHQLLAGISLGNQLLDKGRFAGAQKAGENIDFSHKSIFFP